ncbi:class I lanthipeptide [Kordia sp.]
MKKKNLKSLSLNKKAISVFKINELEQVKGGRGTFRPSCSRAVSCSPF